MKTGVRVEDLTTSQRRTARARASGHRGAFRIRSAPSTHMLRFAPHFPRAGRAKISEPLNWRSMRTLGAGSLRSIGERNRVDIAVDRSNSATNSAPPGCSRAWQNPRKFPDPPGWSESPGRGMLPVPHIALQGGEDGNAEGESPCDRGDGRLPLRRRPLRGARAAAGGGRLPLRAMPPH